MKTARLIASLIALAAALPAAATTTWSATATGVKAVCTTGTESAPSASTDGLLLYGIEAVSVQIETAGTMTAGVTLLAYVRNPISGTWVRYNGGDLTTLAQANQTFDAIPVPVHLQGSRIAWVPSGVGVGSTIYQHAQPKGK